jgi:hypothetical protein
MPITKSGTEEFGKIPSTTAGYTELRCYALANISRALRTNTTAVRVNLRKLGIGNHHVCRKCSKGPRHKHTVAAKRLQVIEESPLGGRVLYFGRFYYHHHVLRVCCERTCVCAFLRLLDKLQCCNCFVNLIAV